MIIEVTDFTICDNADYEYRSKKEFFKRVIADFPNTELMITATDRLGFKCCLASIIKVDGDFIVFNGRKYTPNGNSCLFEDLNRLERAVSSYDYD